MMFECMCDDCRHERARRAEASQAASKGVHTLPIWMFPSWASYRPAVEEEPKDPSTNLPPDAGISLCSEDGREVSLEFDNTTAQLIEKLGIKVFVTARDGNQILLKIREA